MAKKATMKAAAELRAGDPVALNEAGEAVPADAEEEMPRWMKYRLAAGLPIDDGEAEPEHEPRWKERRVEDKALGEGA